MAALTPLATCDVAPRPVSEFVLPADPNRAGGSAIIVDSESQLPVGTRATAAAVAEVQAFAELYTACQNAGDFRRLAALATDEWFRDTLAARMSMSVASSPLEAFIGFLRDSAAANRAEEEAWLARDVAAAPTPLSPPIATVEARDVRVLADGRLGAILVQDGRPTEFQIYARLDGRLLLDQRMDLRLSASEPGSASRQSPAS